MGHQEDGSRGQAWAQTGEVRTREWGAQTEGLEAVFLEDNQEEGRAARGDQVEEVEGEDLEGRGGEGGLGGLTSVQ